MDIALRIKLLSPDAEYFGVPTDQASFEALAWNKGAQPSWADVVAADALEADYLEQAEAREILDASDKDMARVAEDVIGALITAGVLTVADLPAAVTDKLNARQAARAKLV